MKKKIYITAVLTLLYFFAMIKPFIPVIIYVLEYDHIVHDLCVNRDKPYLECNGLCYVNALQKSLGLENTPKQNIPLKIYKFDAKTFYVPDDNDFDLGLTEPTIRRYPGIRLLISQEYYNRLLRPPRLA